MEIKINAANPEAITYNTEELAYTILGGIRLEGLDRLRVTIKIEVVNRGDTAAPLYILPTLWFYNRWCYGGLEQRPVMKQVDDCCVKATHERIGSYYLYFQKPADFFC